jgi:hypothetical protein
MHAESATLDILPFPTGNKSGVKGVSAARPGADRDISADRQLRTATVAGVVTRPLPRLADTTKSATLKLFQRE